MSEVEYYTLPMIHTILTEDFGIDVTVQTLYNWAKRGLDINGERAYLPTVVIANRRVTTVEWLRDYVETLGL